MLSAMLSVLFLLILQRSHEVDTFITLNKQKSPKACQNWDSNPVNSENSKHPVTCQQVMC